MLLIRLIRALPAMALLVALAACDAKDMGDPPHPMGSFRMNSVFIDATKAQTVPLSRTADAEDWKTVMTAAMTERFASYSGDTPFDFGISVDGYVLAPPGVPVIASPRSALIIRLHVYDSLKKEFLEEGGKRFTLIEGVSKDSVIGSGWTQNKHAQMKKLADNAAKAVQDYMLAHPEWLGMPPLPAQTPAAVTSH
ncbi:MAG: hypothetical protein WCO04_08310 [Pseudomonadota bacterium]